MCQNNSSNYPHQDTFFFFFWLLIQPKSNEYIRRVHNPSTCNPTGQILPALSPIIVVKEDNRQRRVSSS